MWDADKLYNEVLSELDGKQNQQDMENKVDSEISLWDQDNIQDYEANIFEMEWGAAQKQNDQDPQYLNIREEDVEPIWIDNGCEKE